MARINITPEEQDEVTQDRERNNREEANDEDIPERRNQAERARTTERQIRRRGSSVL